MKRYCRLFIVLLASILLMACAPDNGEVMKPTEEGKAEQMTEEDKAEQTTEVGEAEQMADSQPNSNDAPDFELKNQDGETVKLSDYRGQKVVLNFWASWCPPCKSEMPEFEALDETFKRDGEAVLLMINLTDNQRETEKKARSYFEDNQYSMTLLFDPETKVSEQYEIYSIPTTVIIDTKGKIIATITGQTTQEDVLASLLLVS